MKQSRRSFLNVGGTSAATLALPMLGRTGEAVPPKKTHLVTLSFDGLDEEGWGPIRAAYLEGLLERLLATDTVEILPAGSALAKYAA